MKLGREELEELRRLKKLLSRLSREELKAFNYVWENISVGEILAEKDLYQHYGIEKPALILRRLREKGLVERGEGCYNLARSLRPLRRKIGGFAELLRLLDRVY